ncbi:MAG: ribonuclease HII [Magnetococcales bacterium]|nr:ribonuclease HII [Magnetococcales bacterium]
MCAGPSSTICVDVAARLPVSGKNAIGRPRVVPPKPDFFHEQPLWDQGFRFVCGVDEVGRGPLAGPVVAAAVVFRQPQPITGLDDSKRLTLPQRRALLPLIQHQCWHAIALASVSEIDRLNIRQAALLAMSRAVAQLACQVDFVLVDGRDLPVGLPCPGKAVVGGDGSSQSIAAASVLAKLYRDDLMIQLDREYPGYGWQGNAGYPTAQHRQALQQLGITPHHRRSFGPVRQLLNTLPLQDED